MSASAPIPGKAFQISCAKGVFPAGPGARHSTPFSLHGEIHGRPVQVYGDDPANLSRTGRIFHPLGITLDAPPHDGHGSTDAIILRLRQRARLPPLPAGVRISGLHQGIRAWTSPDEIWLRCRGHMVRLNPRLGWAEVVVPSEPLPVRKDLLTYALMLLLRRRGLLGLHASGVQRAGDGWLFVGNRGCGKSTQTYNLVRQGWGYLGDDALLLRAEGDRVEALALRRDLMLDPTPAHAYPELARDGPPSSATSGKRRLRIGEMRPARMVDRCSPRFLIFPEIVSTAESTLVPLSRTEALMRLVAQSAVFTLDREMGARHLEVLSHLARQTLAVRLRAGRDLRECPERIAAVLQSV